MINFKNRQVKIISIVIAAVFIFSIVALGVAQYKSSLSSNGSNSNVGKIDMQQAIVSSPGYQPAVEKYQQFVKESQTKLQTELPKLNPQQQQELMVKMQTEAQAKEKELIEPIVNNVNDTIGEVADKKGLSVVVNVNDVLYGGQDITQDVVKALQAKGDKATAPAQDAKQDSKQDDSKQENK